MTIVCMSYTRAVQNSRVAFVDLAFPENGVILRGCHLHRSPTGKEWVSWPAIETGRGYADARNSWRRSSTPPGSKRR
jgi:hypothetical protein